jgi:ABC-type nitrate/sulfonate/bicarbonate transport system substrate-binding protein
MARGILVLSLLALGLFAAAGRIGAQGQVLILTGTDPNFAPIILAAEKGFFTEAGVQVAHRMFPSGTDAMLAFRGIRAQFVASGDMPALVLWGGGDAVGVAPFFGSPHNLFVVAASSIQAPGDLKGKRIATKKGSSAEYLLSVYLRRHGLKPSDLSVVDLSPPDMVPALVRGQIDGFVIWRPYPSQAQAIMKDKVRILATAVGYHMERMFLSASKEYADKNPGEVQKVLRALQRSIDYMDANPQEASKIIAAKIKTDPAIVNDVLSSKPFSMVFDEQARNDLEELSKFLLEERKLKGPLSIAEAVDVRFLRAVKPDFVR